MVRRASCYCECVSRKTDIGLPAVAHWLSATERVVVPGRLRWRKGERVRVLDVEADSPPGIVAVLAAHRDFPGLGFILDLNGVGDLVGFVMRPLVQVRDGPITAFEVNAVGFPADTPAITSR